jgi:hypothetical protein
MQIVLSILAILGIGSIVAGLISWRIAVSNFRQSWINALRDDLATYLKELENMHHAIGRLLHEAGPDEEQNKQDARVAVLFVYWRIVLRLNRVEPMHIELRQKLDDMMIVSAKVPDRDKIEEIVDLARRILKQEWNVTKYGMFTSLVAWMKACE